MSASWRGGSTRAWRHTRALVLARDNHACRLLLPGCTRGATHVHHLDGKAGGDDPARLVAACPPCNWAVGDPAKTADPAPRPATRW